MLTYLRSLAGRIRAMLPSRAVLPSTFDQSEATLAQPVPYDENLLERSRTQWQFGDWDSLAGMDRDTLQHHPDRAKLALLAAAGHAQRGSLEQARRFVRLARDWGCGRQLISQVLISGVHNSLGRVAAVAGGQEGRALYHFEKSITVGIPGGDGRLLTEARVTQQVRGLSMPKTSRIAVNILSSESKLPRLGFAAASSQALASSEGRRFTPEKDKYAVLALIHQLHEPASYLEIGVGQGRSLALAACPAVGVDPAPRELAGLPDSARVITATSDEFFADMAGQELPQAPDLILLDGMPLLEYLLRDFTHAEGLSHADTLIAVPGVLPPDPAQATRRRTGPDWTGDVWKLPEILRTHRPDLRLLLLNSTPAGLLLVAGLNPASTILSDNTQEILSTYQPQETLPDDILHRTAATPPDKRVIADFLGGM
ncbi:class I SAM-dependent methyltransferase [Desulfonatronum parangueonense]